MIFLVSSVLLIFSVYSAYIDIDFFITKKKTTGKILGIKNQGEHDPLLVKVWYYNSFVNKVVTCNVEIANDNENKLRKSDLNNVLLSYAKGNSQIIYLYDYKEPKIGLIFFDVLMIIAMSIAIYAAIKPGT